MRKIIQLFELQKLQTNNIKSLSSADEILVSNGFTEIGSGMFAAVYGHPGLDYVLKVFKPDKGYYRFYKLASEHQNNPHFPKFRGKLMQVVKDVYAIRMEKLQKATISNLGQRPNEFVRTIDKYLYGNYNKEKFISLEREQPGLLDTLDLLKTTYHDFDIHDENFMMRGNVVVITDPFSS